MPRLMPVLTSLFWAVMFAGYGVTALRAGASGDDFAPSVTLSATLSLTVALSFAWLSSAQLFARDFDEKGARGISPAQMVYGGSLVIIATTMLAASLHYGIRAIIDGGVVASGIILSFQLSESMEKVTPVPTSRPAMSLGRHASHLALLDRNKRSGARGKAER